ncbi:MAG: hydrogenase maturation protease [Waddliaceae bacterium]
MPKKGNLSLIGIGNEFRRDDGAGPFIIRELKKRSFSNAALFEHGGEGVDLLELWKGFDTVILFDAVSSGKKPGKIFRIEIPPQTIPKDLYCYSTHSFSVAEGIELAKTLNLLPKQVILYGIEGKTFEAGIGLSPEVQQSCQSIIEEINNA